MTHNYTSEITDGSGLTWEEAVARLAAGTHPLVRSLRSDWLDSPAESPPTPAGIPAPAVAAVRAEAATSAAAELADTTNPHDGLPPRFLLGDSPGASPPTCSRMSALAVATAKVDALASASASAEAAIVSTVSEPPGGSTLSEDSQESGPPRVFMVSQEDLHLLPSTSASGTAHKKLSAGFHEIFHPPIERLSERLKELVDKQNKIQIDLSEERKEYNNDEMAELHEMMDNLKIYREKLMKIRKQMQSVYSRTKTLKKRSENIQACKQKELERKIQKQKQEEALIGQVL